MAEETNKRSGWGLFLAVLALALVLRVAWGVLVPVEPVSDSAAYERYAMNLAEGHGYGQAPGEKSAYWPVGAPFIYAVLFRVFGHVYWPVVALNVLVGVGTVACVMGLGSLLWRREVGLLAGLFLALWPSQVQFSTVIASELPFALLTTGLVWLSLSPWKKPWIKAILAGILLAAAAYVRPTALLIPFVLGIIQLLRKEPFLRTAGTTAVMFVVMMALILPWSLRNQAVFGEFVLISTNGGTNLWMGNNPHTDGTYMKPPHPEGMNEAERNRYLSEEAKAYIKAEPVAFLKNAVIKFIKTHDRETIGVGWNEPGLKSRFPDKVVSGLKGVSTLYWWAVLALGVAGAFMVLAGGLIRFFGDPAVMFWGYYAGIHAVTVAQDRYHFASIPFIAILAAAALFTAWNRVRGKREAV